MTRLVLLLVAAACSHPRLRPAPHEAIAPTYKDALLQAIRGADRIEIVEHSSPWDFSREQRKTAKEIEYAAATIDAAEFGAAAAAMDEAAQETFFSCIPAYHHTIWFYRAGAPADALDICFQCGYVEFTGFGGRNPAAIWPILKDVVTQAGLHTRRDWRALAAGAR